LAAFIISPRQQYDNMKMPLRGVCSILVWVILKKGAVKEIQATQLKALSFPFVQMAVFQWRCCHPFTALSKRACKPEKILLNCSKRKIIWSR